MSAVTSAKLQGHKGAVLCLAHSSSSPEYSYPQQQRAKDKATPSDASSSSSATVAAACLLSGSEDSTARLWDLRTNNWKASFCIKTGGDVLSVAFGPTWETPYVDPSEAAASSPFAREFSVYMAVENTVLAYDLRNASCPVVNLTTSQPQQQPPQPLTGCFDMSFLEAPDEINQIAFSPSRRGRPLHLAAADDGGTVRVTDCIQPSSQKSQSPRKRVLHHSSPEAPALVTSTAFQPRAKHLILASGGTDCTVKLFDATKPRRALSTQTIANTDVGTNQVCNPPMVHSLAWSPSGRMLTAALGDGSLCIFQSDSGRSLTQVARLEEAHSGPVAAVLYPQWTRQTTGECSSQQPQHAACYDRLVASAGNDGAIVLWDFGSDLCGDGAENPATFLPLGGASQSRGSTVPINNNNNNNNKKKLTQNLHQAMGDLDIVGDGPQTLFAWNHGLKPNWVVSSAGKDPVFPSSLFVADTSHDITVYTVPMI